MNLLVEIRFNDLDYRQIIKLADSAYQLCRDEMVNEKIRYQKLDIFFSLYRLVIWVRLGQDGDQQPKEPLVRCITELSRRLEKGSDADILGLTAFLDGELLPIRSGKLQAVPETTVGNKRIALKGTQHYWREMSKHKVLVDNNQREKYIRQLMAEAASNLGGEIISSPLMNEVVITAEQPVIKQLTFNDDLMDLPERLVIIVLERNKCFVIKAQEQLVNTAVYVCNKNCDVPNLVEQLSRVKERYLSDLEISVEERVQMLKKLPYLNQLGSYFNKQKRLQKIVLAIADQVDAGENVCSVGRQASEFAKLDQTTETCLSFPEFQGHMGKILAEKHGAPDMVASAVLEHMYPGKYSRKLPHTLVGALLGVADRLDDICGHYHQDEFRLSHYRRVKTWFDEVIAILDSVALDISMTRLLKFSLSLYESQNLVPWREKDLAYLLKVFSDRLFFYLEDNDYSSTVAAALTGVEPDNIYVTLQKANIMTDHKFAEEVETCAEICKILDRVCTQEYQYDEAAREFLEQQEEKDLFEIFHISAGAIREAVESRKFDEVITKLAKFRAPMLRFLDTVDLDTNDQPVKFNRLSLLAEIRQLFHLFADFSLL